MGVTEAAAWRPQSFGTRSARAVDDPVIEPLWSGQRVLVTVSSDGVDLRDADGEPQSRPAIAAAIGQALLAESAVLDGYLTIDAARSGVGVIASIGAAGPTAGDVARQMLIGGAGRKRRTELVERLESRAEVRQAPGDEVVFVAVDLLMIDGEPLLDVPLLERKRVLDSALVPGDLVRLGIHVRPPIEPWLPTWRNVGFRQLAYKAANGRYRPGEPNDGWATADIPTR